MTPLASQVYEAAMALADEERAELASRLLESLPQDTPSQLHPAWGMNCAAGWRRWIPGR